MRKQNILLLGEYSGYFNNLAKGLKKIGHNVVLASTGDRYKDFYRDIDLSYNLKNSITSNLKRIWVENNKINQLKNFDVVQIINPNVFSRFGNNINLYKKILNNNDKVFLSAVGDDFFWWDSYRKGSFIKSPHQGTLEDENSANSVWETSKGLIRANKFLVNNVKGIIPGAAVYKTAYKIFDNCRDVIPFPIDVNKFDFQENIVKNKVVFFHGAQLNRYGFKGTNTIDKALNEMVAKYSSDLIYRRTDSIPFDKYTKLISQTNVLIDQTNSPEPAMNALISMLKGKLVMGGCEEMFLNEFNLDYSPLINITNDVKQIQRQVEWVLDNRDLIGELSKRGREYVQLNHDSILVAEKFLNEWKKK